MAKGVEDTAFYRYNRFIALNEVGSNPDEFGIGLAQFHNANAERAKRWPGAMLATATHDTKRGEDTRARLAVLSEIPDEWQRQVQAWSRILRARRGDVEGSAPPDRNDEYMFYQLLVGAWPVELVNEISDTGLLQAFAERVKGTMIKSVREAKLQSSWDAPNNAYEEAVLSFISDALDPSGTGHFLASFLSFVSEIAEIGAHNTIAQTVLKLTVPGVPDFYQGTELWDLSMVDPDNRRTVDYSLRARLLDEVTAELACDRCSAMKHYLDSWQDGRFKLAIITTLLDYRRKHEELFRAGSYRALQAMGPGLDQICAFQRRCHDDVVLIAVARHPVRFQRSQLAVQTFLPLPDELHNNTWRDLLTGLEHHPSPLLYSEDLFTVMPAVVLVRA
jgi:(1->4)-alpha-D-glucan 1-alpha-D-glucosylmutase